MRLGLEIRRRRKALGWTLETLAHRSGLSEHYLSNLENVTNKAKKERDPSLSTVLAVSKALGVAPGELLGGAGDVSPAAMEAARLFDTASEEAQEAVLRVLRVVSKRRR